MQPGETQEKKDRDLNRRSSIYAFATRFLEKHLTVRRQATILDIVYSRSAQEAEKEARKIERGRAGEAAWSDGLC